MNCMYACLTQRRRVSISCYIQLLLSPRFSDAIKWLYATQRCYVIFNVNILPASPQRSQLVSYAQFYHLRPTADSAYLNSCLSQTLILVLSDTLFRGYMHFLWALGCEITALMRLCNILHQRRSIPKLPLYRICVYSHHRGILWLTYAKHDQVLVRETFGKRLKGFMNLFQIYKYTFYSSYTYYTNHHSILWDSL